MVIMRSIENSGKYLGCGLASLFIVNVVTVNAGQIMAIARIA
jgi:hypothetical protein